MGSPTSATTENPQPPRRPAGADTKGTSAATTDVVVDAADSDERSRRGPWPSEAPMAGVLGELAFYYGACWLHYRSSAQRPEK